MAKGALASGSAVELDQGICCAVGAAAGIGKLLKLDRTALGSAISIALVSNLSLRVSRMGELSEWKAVAAPFAARNGLLACRLAQAGLGGPLYPFEGSGGLIELLPEFELGSLGDPEAVMLGTSFKRHAACYGCYPGIDAALTLRQQVRDIRRVRPLRCIRPERPGCPWAEGKAMRRKSGIRVHGKLLITVCPIA